VWDFTEGSSHFGRAFTTWIRAGTRLITAMTRRAVNSDGSRMQERPRRRTQHLDLTITEDDMLFRSKVSAALVAALAAIALGALPGSAQAPPPGSVVAQAHTRADASASALPAQPDRAADPQVDAEDVPTLDGTAVRSYDAFDANQGVAIGKRHFYAVNNRTITKHDRSTGEALLQFAGVEDGPIEHLDSGVVVNRKLYAAHSNYPEWPMESSIEVFNARTMRPIDTHSFGIYRGSLTWLDRHDGAWWAAFANYDKVQEGQTEPYGKTYNTQVVKMDNAFQVVQSWTIPKAILDKFDLMSNSGGSWGPDGRLYLTGHDLPEAYVMKVPRAGAELEWIATVRLPGIEGQGIAWDNARSKSTLWGISRENSKVINYSIPFRSISDPETLYWEVLGPGEFEQ